MQKMLVERQVKEMTDLKLEEREKNRREEYRQLQEKLGCDNTCKYCDVEMLKRGPCCCFIYIIKTDENGKCTTRRKEGEYQEGCEE